MNTFVHTTPYCWATSELMKRIAMFLILCFGMSGCSIVDFDWEELTNPAVKAEHDMLRSIDAAISELGAANADWQRIIKDLSTKIPDRLDQTIRVEINGVVQRALATAGTQFECQVDFVATRVRQHLIKIKAEILKTPVPAVEPTFCQVHPTFIDMNLDPAKRNVVEFYGYDMDLEGVKVMLETSGSPSQVDITSKLSKQTHYHMLLQLGGTPNPLSAASKEINLLWNGQELSTVAVVQPTTPVCVSDSEDLKGGSISVANLSNVKGDREFDGNGPRVTGTVREYVSGNEVRVVVSVTARETKSDWSTFTGSKTTTLYTVKPGWRIDRLVGKLDDTFTYVDSNHDEDGPWGGGPGGPVNTWTFMGDSDGDDNPYVTVLLNARPDAVIIKQTANCVSAYSAMHLQDADTVTPATKQRFEAELKQVKPTILKLPILPVPGKK